MQRAAASNLLCILRGKRIAEGSDPHRADVDLRNQCSYATLDVDDPESGDGAANASAAVAMRTELE
jgi:hypothetical protein